MTVPVDEDVVQMAERTGQPLRVTDDGVEWGDLDVLRQVSVDGDRLVVTTTERGKTRTDFATDDAPTLSHYLLLQFGQQLRRARGLPVPVNDEYPPVPAQFEVRPGPPGCVALAWTGQDGRTVTAEELWFGAERRFANVCRVPLPVLAEALLDDSGRPQPLF